MAMSKKILLVIAALSIVAVTVILSMPKENVALEEIPDCQEILVRGWPTIIDYGSNFVALQALNQKKLRVGQSYRFEHIILGPRHKVKLVLATDSDQRNYLVTIEDEYAAPYENTGLRWINLRCKKPADVSQKSLLSDISSLFVKFDSVEWKISDAIEMFSDFEAFQSNAIYHYVIYIKGNSKNAPINSASFDATVETLSFATVDDAQRYYRIENDILQRSAWGNMDVAINIATSEHQSYCYHNSRISAHTGCVFIGRSDEMVVEIELFPRSKWAKLEQVKLYWPEFVKNLWPSVLDSYGAVLKAP